MVYSRARRRAQGVLPWWVVIALCSDSRVQSLHCAVTAEGGSWHGAGGAGCGRRKEEEVGVVFVLVGSVPLSLCHVFIHV